MYLHFQDKFYFNMNIDDTLYQYTQYQLNKYKHFLPLGYVLYDNNHLPIYYH